MRGFKNNVEIDRNRKKVTKTALEVSIKADQSMLGKLKSPTTDYNNIITLT